jgi:D-beta-D-heptose 7-phosphate kinase/D-beta-D-heptose 1-phosphate adenosyltransferase
MKLSRNNVLVVGDVMLDVYYFGDVKRISPEAPVPVFSKRGERSVLGGAANVAANLVAAGQQTSVLSIVGTDENGSQVHELMSDMKIDDSMVIDTERPTTTKTRFLADNNQQVLRLDEENSSPIGQEIEDALLRGFDERVNDFDAIVVSDYMKGLLTKRFTQALISKARAMGINVFIDVKDSDKEKYCGATVIKPNLNELKLLTGMKITTEDEVISAANSLLDACAADYVLCTLGGKGMLLISHAADPVYVPAVGKEVYDVTGAGDTAIAYLAACVASGYSVREAMKFADTAAGIQVSKAGTSSVYPKEVREVLDGLSSGRLFENRQITLDQAFQLRQASVGKTIVFTNGCFDILHAGHVQYLRQAASLGDILVVGVNSDSSVRAIKGDSRPVNPLEDRIAILSSFDFIDYVIAFDEETPYEVIKAVQPDVLVKGGDYSISQIVGRDIVEARGGEVKVLPYIEGKSSTNIINKILALGNGN